MPFLADKQAYFYLLLEEILHAHNFRVYLVMMIVCMRLSLSRKRKRSSKPYRMIPKFHSQVMHLNRMVKFSDVDCVVNLRMDRNTFGRLCLILKQLGGLEDGKYVTVEEQVALFLSILAHHKKNRIVGFNFQRSGSSVSHYIHLVLQSIIKLHGLFLVKPIPVMDDCVDPRWKLFKGCVGALDGTYINVMVKKHDQPRYRTRKGEICTNTLAACDINMKFVYVLPGWEGSAADGRVLRDAVNRPHGLKVPRGSYYLADNGYANSEGFLTPYKGVRYHLKEWGPNAITPQNPKEMFNMRHTKARNVIERAFGVLKMRWGILRSASYYPVKVQNWLIMACFLLHNFIRSNMVLDPIEEMFDNINSIEVEDEETVDEFIDYVEATAAWNQKRDELAEAMWNA